MRYNWHFAFSFLTALLLVDFVTSAEPWDDVRIKHTWHAVPAGWESLGHPSADTTIDLYIALKPVLESALIDALFEISNPRHPRYGAYLLKDQVAELVKPHLDTLELAGAWLAYHGIRSSSISTTHGGGWLTVTNVLVSQANQLLGASYQLYRNAKTNDTIIRTVGYALPAVLDTHIQTVAPTTYFSSMRVMWQTPPRRPFGGALAAAASGMPVTARSSRTVEVSPSYLRWLYDTNTYKPAAIGQNSLGVVGLGDEYPSQGDLNKFMADFYTVTAAATFTVMQMNGNWYDQSNIGDQANIEIQYASAMAYPTPLIFYNIGSHSEWPPSGLPMSVVDMYLRWFKYILEEPIIPRTISVSFGGDERDLPPDYAENLCNLFGRLGTRGVSVLVASGDDGVGPENCDDGSGNVRFIPEFPSSCPYVTTVGGAIDINPEIAADFSGGGFSSYFPRPDYQDGAVSKFFQSPGDKHEGRYNPSGRGYPDIAAQALNFPFVYDAAVLEASGTSCAVSTVAGIISLINDHLISKGKEPLGFLNPWLYGEGLEGLEDIGSGSNRGCGTTGFSAITGWDPVTGLGTLDFQRLLTHLPTRPQPQPQSQPQAPGCSSNCASPGKETD